MSVRRAVALTVILCALGVGTLALPWFAADLPGRDVTISGPEASPLVWVIAAAGPVIVVLALRASRRGRLTGITAWRSLLAGAVVAALAAATALVTSLAPSIAVRAADVAAAPQVDVHRLPAGFVAAGAFAGVASLLLSWMIGIANAVEDQPDPTL